MSKEPNPNPKDEPINHKEPETINRAVDEIVESEADELLESKNEHPAEMAPKKPRGFKRFWHWAATHKKITIPLLLVLILVALAAVPFTRYAIAGLFIKQNFIVEITDSETGRPVSDARVLLGEHQVVTDGNGRAEIRASVGYQNLKASKTYYQEFNREVLVPITTPEAFKISLTATGRTVPVSVVNSISKQDLAGVHLESADAKVTTDQQGNAIMVVPADKTTIPVTLSADGYNSKQAILQVTTDDVSDNNFSLTPAGKIYFLSNQSGEIDVVKSNLDGTDRKVVVAGTGNEEGRSTTMLATHDWRYIVLESKRDGGEYSKLFLIDTSDDSLSVIDEGKAFFTVGGWDGHRLVYSANRMDLKPWQPKKVALKSYNTEDKQITLIDTTNAHGNQNDYTQEGLAYPYIMANGEVVYIQNTYRNHDVQKGELVSVMSDGQNMRTIRSYGKGKNSDLNWFNPTEIRFYIRDTINTDDEKLYSYTGDGKVTEIEGIASGIFDNENRYIVSPDGQKTAWAETRDGKSVIFVGSISGANPKQAAMFDDSFTVHGWFSNDYLILSKDDSSLYMMPAGGSIESESQILKVSDYFREDFMSEIGYGGM